MCLLPATTVEHVPPRALFPEFKDSGGRDFRLNLVTVPSCTIHNNSKSDDDEFLMVSLAGIIGNNSIGYRHKLTKVDRAVRRSSHRLLGKVFTKRHEPRVIALEGNKFLEVIWGTPDVDRLLRCFDQIVRGLHFHHFGAPLDGTIQTILGYLEYSNEGTKNFVRFIVDRAEIDLEGKPRCGSNPDVFYYQVTDPDQFGIFLFRLCFYGGLSVYSAVTPRGVEKPGHLGIELMKLGVKTVFTLGDKTYEVN
jgi:hypothetical protein